MFSFEQPAVPSNDGQTTAKRISYKFERLRERIRQAIADGELNGKLPGERALARQFNANAKTLSKALTDLAAEGLLERTIGRGTFVRGSAPASEMRSARWLVICDPGRESCTLVNLLFELNAELHVADNESVGKMRPSFLSQFAAVIDLSRGAPADATSRPA